MEGVDFYANRGGRLIIKVEKSFNEISLPLSFFSPFSSPEGIFSRLYILLLLPRFPFFRLSVY